MTTVKDTSMRALVVEDEADYAELLESLLREDRYAVETAAPFGLGLAFCQSAEAAHHGRIWFDSQQGQETTIYVPLPGLMKMKGLK